ncbi:MAG TPA: thiamine-phosphate kinase [Phycisphaerales bacterium]|nr:thiamine-phosphate kinase [Phycisphaerales bacterium]
MSEFQLLHHIYSANRNLASSVIIPPGDDMAMLQLSGSRILAAVDQLIDGRHFNLKSTPLNLIARKAIARSVSDIAAMAAHPSACLVAAILPPDFPAQRANELFDHMRAAAESFHCPLIGGDIAFHSSPSHPLTLSVTVLAEPRFIHDQSSGGVAHFGAVTRSGAQPSDLLCVTGLLGGSLEPSGLGRHLTFEPRVNLALALAETLGPRLHAMIDISDGLGRDASHIAESSNVTIHVDASAIPCNPGVTLRNALSDGEDYELLFTAQPPIPTSLLNIPITTIGRILPPNPSSPHRVFLIENNTQTPIDHLGWEHSAERAGD